MEIALLTSAITINKEIVGHKKISENERLQQYVNALIFYITQSNFDVLIFCDGTNYDINQLQFLSNLANLYGKQVEFLSFQQNLQKVIEKGK
ncbi:MAG: hypothetical protein LBU27_09635 [Candidatus Peribacteria bacterium]|jgi:hypothetical protein|nr:hypothetical protein [Candidatus Peribacteria bacterium]